MHPDDFSDTDEIEDEEWDDRSFLGEGSSEDYQMAMDRFPGRRTSAKPQPTAGIGRSRFGLRPDKLWASRTDRSLTLRYRKDNEPLYRYDSRHHDVIFNEGFRPWNGKAPRSLAHYQLHLQRTALVSASRNGGSYVPSWAIGQDGTTNLYVIQAPGGIDMIATLKRRAGLEMQEVAFWKGIRPEFIDRVEVRAQPPGAAHPQLVKVISRRAWLQDLEHQGRTLQDGSWRGPGGLTLTVEENQEATDLWRNASEWEPHVTEGLRSLVLSLNRHLLFFSSLKEENSLKRKLATQLHENPALSIRTAVLHFNDAVRYTVGVTRDDKYANRVRDVLDGMKSAGFRLSYLKNTWGKPGYQGINTGWHDPQRGVTFEVQFHTERSARARETAHRLFEKMRTPGKDAQEMAVLRAESMEIFRHVPVPPGATSLR
ncbi:hypothetical protein ABZ379_49430 [Streptomyces canus]|uniref:scabin-related ADP-ribosyltransferase n=1 Tax=Streptomyces canus TaxID=58343 RepID=UPI0033EBFAE6